MELRKEGRPVLRDSLAVLRTTLANERTLLAYLRTALTLFAVGATFIKFFGHAAWEALGWALLPASLIVLAKGIMSFRATAMDIAGDEKASLEMERGR